MTKSLFRQSFLFDSLDLDQEMVTGEIKTAAGITLKVLSRGVLEVIPAHLNDESKHIIISCGIHGDETAPMELVNKLVDDIQSGFQAVQHRCLFIVAHPQATNQHTRFVQENLNRLFDDKKGNTSLEREIAQHLKQTVKDFFEHTAEQNRWHLDLHCAIRHSKHYSFAVSPKSRHPVRSRALMALIESAHIEAVLLSNSPSSTFSWYSAENFAAQALTLELGQVAPLGQNNLERLVAFDLAMRDLVANATPEHLPRKPTIYRVSRTIVRLHDDFDFMFDDNVENFTAFKHGEVFGHDGEKPLMAKNEDEAIVFPNRKVALGQRAALMVCKVATRYEDDQLVYD
ncbi:MULTISPECIES: succinylglutamate desuccinylase [Vibrio]|uniref:succinylglutamate desuccinylase n=1 Tax=Vibrio TaxID=662 RepID=UPI000645CF0C|nr:MULTISPECIES: succinylglutamate desuccinylase [Vibrio]AQM19414.1 succinylglutamate desuccinylase [Vibrio anguillarum]AQP35973.1 succinylglutamate desuccinylase [Vibrio anguillarum]AUB87809.1 succinylglutamate desuccinylase [Vibrio anguillarum]AUB91251.1 succinylglutamate desuccinylase [Vibrio anguillarum]AUB94690.1 succinylglutamate desuccinylase [Vibrio anguillarum]